MNVMMDEALSNLTCKTTLSFDSHGVLTSYLSGTLAKYGYSDNTVLIVAGDNGGEPSMKGNSVPFKGHKNSTFRGGVSNTAIIHSKLIPEDYRGTSFNGMIHITGKMSFLFLADAFLIQSIRRLVAHINGSRYE